MTTVTNDEAGHKSPVLKSAWDRFQATMEELRVSVENCDQFDTAPDQRARAYHQLMEAQAMAYNFAIAPSFLRPRVYRMSAWQTDVYCSGGNGPDFNYGVVFLDGTQTYRLKVSINDSAMFLAQHNSALPGSPGSKMLANYDFENFEVRADGTFEVILSAERHEGNWIPLQAEADYQWMLFRPSIVGWEKIPAKMEIERLSQVESDYYSRYDFDDATMARRIDAAADYARYITTEWMILFYQRVRANSGGDNIFKTIGPAISGEVGSPTAEYWFAAVDIEDDEALIVHLPRPMDGVYWGAQLFDVWLRSLDFRARQSTLNSGYAHQNADGGIRFVICRHDPGYANWIDNCSFTKGQLLIRNYRSSEAANPVATKVPYADLAKHLPADMLVLTAPEREKELAARLASYALRHGE